ncbi:MAG: NAD(P)H-dependent glycerol-3-phosphate dehydrogenase [Acidimicrobiia bacterium]
MASAKVAVFLGDSGMVLGSLHGMSMRVAVIGAGSWGTTVASIAALNAPTVLWCRRPELADEINRDHRNSGYLRGFELPRSLRATASLDDAVDDADVIVMGVPSHGYRDILAAASDHVRAWVPVVSLTKGLEADSLARMSQVTSEVLPGHPVAVLTGPNLAKEVMAGHPAATVIATNDASIGSELQRIFVTPRLRVYTNPDVVGCEIAGVVKNVLAIAAGMAEGMGFGDNTKATLMTRGLAELSRFGVALGGNPVTFTGLAGMGDLIATCSSAQSRNHMVGVALGQGRAIGDIVNEMHMVAEGVKSSPAVVDLARSVGIEMPISEQVVAVCHGGRSAREAVSLLMGRQQRSEVDGRR